MQPCWLVTVHGAVVNLPSAATHCSHAVHACCPAASVKLVAATHASQASLELLLRSAVPAAQGTHVVAVALLPAPQATQAVLAESSSSASSSYVPPAHAAHVEVPAAAYVPAAQTMQLGWHKHEQGP